MEYVPGDNLGEIMRKENVLPPKRAAMIALELVRMLDKLDRVRPPVVHGDLKPGNVLVSGEADVRVVDFGIAKQLAHGRGTFNQYQSIPYSSPERLRTGDVDPQSDLWSTGVMLYEMIAGAHPFSAPLNMIRMRTLDGNGPDPLPPGCPEALRNIILKALAISPSDRYPAAKAMAQDLARYLNGHPVAARCPDPNATVRTARPVLKKSLLPPQLTRRVPKPILRLGRLFSRYRADVRLALAGVVLFALVLFARQQYLVHSRAAELRRALLAGEVSLMDASDQLTKLRKSAWLPLLLYGLQDTVKGKLLDEGSEPIMDYRQDQPTASIADWQRAGNDLRRLLELDPRNKIARGRELICEGQIERIRSRSLVHGRTVSNPRLLSQAIGHFLQAAELMPDSPDPYLALAPIYLYYEQDYDRGMAMQEAAVKRGHSAGKRETAQMADTLRANGKRELILAQQLDDTPDRKKQHLENAVSAFESSIEYYGQISGFAGANQGLRDALQSKQHAQRLLDEMAP
jgi:tetratricopeptide (TPR) repeat protein